MRLLFHVMEATALLHLGQWRQLTQEINEALAMAERNANKPASVLCRLIFAWLHVEAMDFERAKEHFEEIEVSAEEANPFAFFFHRAVFAKALVGLRLPVLPLLTGSLQICGGQGPLFSGVCSSKLQIALTCLCCSPVEVFCDQQESCSGPR